MEHNPLKQRLIGAIVLVALAVIFIPMLLDGGGGEQGVSFGTNIPPKPADQRQVRVLQLHDMPKPPEQKEGGRALIDKDLTAPPPAAPAPSQSRTGSEATASGGEKPPAPEAGASSQADTHKADTKAPAKSAADSQAGGQAPAPKAWAVQVGSFSHHDNALALRDRLRAKHFPAFVDAVHGKDGTVYRVRVGPEVRRADAEALQKRVAKHIKGKTLVVSHP